MPIIAGRIVAGGWDQSERILLISHDGCSVSDLLTGTRIIRNRDAELTFAAMSPDNLSFLEPKTGERISIFGLWGGDGNHVTADGWQVEVVYRWWPQTDILIRPPHAGGVRGYLDGAYLIQGLASATWLGCGFSPSGRRLMLLESDGPKVYVR